MFRRRPAFIVRRPILRRRFWLRQGCLVWLLPVALFMFLAMRF